MSRYYDLKAEARHNALLLCILAFFVVIMLYFIFGLEHILIGLPIALLITSPMLWGAYKAFLFSMDTRE